MKEPQQNANKTINLLNGVDRSRHGHDMLVCTLRKNYES